MRASTDGLHARLARNPLCVRADSGLPAIGATVRRRTPGFAAAAFVFLIVIGGADNAALAQLRPEIAGCAQLNGPGIQALMEACNAHNGCRAISQHKKDCTAAHAFFAKLQHQLASRGEITNNDVFEANSPPLRPVPGLRQQVAAIQKLVLDSLRAPNFGKLEMRVSPKETIYYEGGLTGDRMQGVGVFISSNGAMHRGQFENGIRSGQGQSVSSDGTFLYAGSWRDGKMAGTGARQFPNGQVSLGTRIPDIGNLGMWEITDPAGYTTKVLYGNDGKELARGPKAPPGELALEPSAAPSHAPANLNGEWEGERTGNRVKIQVRSTGIAVARVTQNTGQSSPMLYVAQGEGSYRMNFSGGWSIVETLSTNKIRVKNSDGWNDTFMKLRGAPATSPAPAVASAGNHTASGDSNLPVKPAVTGPSSALTTPAVASAGNRTASSGTSLPVKPAVTSPSSVPGGDGNTGPASRAGSGASVKLTASDLAACKKEIDHFYHMVRAYEKKQETEYCTTGTRSYSAGNCAIVKKGNAETAAMGATRFYMKGNDSCSATDYPCFGSDHFGVLGSEEMVRQLAEKPIEGNLGEIWGYSFVVDKCAAKLWIAKKDGKTLAGDAAPAGGESTKGRAPAQGGSGNPSSGRSSRPQANPNPAGSATPAAATGPTRVAAVNSCIKVIRGGSPGAGQYGVFKNTCEYRVFYKFCAEHPKPDSWLSSFDCDKGQFGSDTVGPHDVQATHTQGARRMHVAACRYGDGYDGPRDGVWDAQKRVIKFYCTYQRSPR